MFCPECGAEYREGFLKCSDCQVSLVHELPRTDSPVGDRGPLPLAPLMEVANPIRLAVIRSVLEAAGIASVVYGESPHTLGGIEFSGRKPALLQVAEQDLEEALSLVAALELPDEELAEPDG